MLLHSFAATAYTERHPAIRCGEYEVMLMRLPIHVVTSLSFFALLEIHFEIQESSL